MSSYRGNAVSSGIRCDGGIPLFSGMTQKKRDDKKNMKKVLLFLILFIPQIVWAEDANVSDDMSKQMELSKLKREVSELEIKLSECKRKNKNWRTATWIGAAGTVATGTAAIVQGVKLNNLKKEKANAKQNEK